MSTTTPARPVSEADGSARPHWTAVLRRRRVRAMIVAAVVVLALFVTWLVAFSSAFGVRSIQVHGTHVLTAAEVEGRADIARGTPLVRVDTAAITSRVESLSEVASAQVETSFPSSVVITVVERTPVGYVRDGNLYRLIDRTGDAYRAVPNKPHGLPTMVVPTAAADRAARRAVAHVAESLHELPPAARPRVESIQALAPDAITVVLSRGRVVQWGTDARNADKARVLPIMLRKKSAERFDVSDPDRPYSS